MKPSERVLFFYLLAVKILKSSIAEIDEMPLALLFDLINVYNKFNSKDDGKIFIDDIL